MNHLLNLDLRLLERSEARAYRVDRGGAMNAIFSVVEDRALDGQVLCFDVPFPYKGDILMLKAGCFGDIGKRRIAFLIDHEASMEAASTDDALELMMDDDRLQFRLDLSKCKNGPVIARMCQMDNRAAVSHGSDILEEHRETIFGHSVRVVTRARLKEITICKEGALGDNAFAMVVDKTVTAKPVAGSRSATMKAGQTLHKVSRAVRKLKAQAMSTYGDSKPFKPRWPTLDESNQQATEERERLVAHARKYHGISG